MTHREFTVCNTITRTNALAVLDIFFFVKSEILNPIVQLNIEPKYLISFPKKVYASHSFKSVVINTDIK